MRRRFLALVPAWTWVASLAVHGAVVVGVGWLAYRSLEKAPAPPPAPPDMGTAVTIELPLVAEGTLLADRLPDPTGEPSTPAGGSRVARNDTGVRGHGGDPTVDRPATNLSDVDERLRLSTDLVSDLERDQEQRIHSAAERTSREDRRSTTHPMELTFLASGSGDRLERRRPSEADPSRGAREALAPSVRGGNLGAPEPVQDGDAFGAPVHNGDASGAPWWDASRRAERGGERLGSSAASPGIGVRDGRPGLDHRASAAVMHARPDVALAPVSVPAIVRDRPNDNVDSDQDVANAVRSLVHASTAGGLAGEGIGGSGGGGDPGAGGVAGPGSRSTPLGEGDGDWFDLNTNDPRLVTYFRRIHAKVDPLWADAFPKSALLELKQGTVILEFTIQADGTARVFWPPVRPSGIDEFDRNCADAIRKASPFDPIPKELGRVTLHVRAPFVASNPIVH